MYLISFIFDIFDETYQFFLVKSLLCKRQDFFYKILFQTVFFVVWMRSLNRNRNRRRNRNRNLSKVRRNRNWSTVGTRTVKNSYGSATQVAVKVLQWWSQFKRQKIALLSSFPCIELSKKSRTKVVHGLQHNVVSDSCLSHESGRGGGKDVLVMMALMEQYIADSVLTNYSVLTNCPYLQLIPVYEHYFHLIFLHLNS